MKFIEIENLKIWCCFKIRISSYKLVDVQSSICREDTENTQRRSRMYFPINFTIGICYPSKQKCLECNKMHFLNECMLRWQTIVFSWQWKSLANLLVSVQQALCSSTEINRKRITVLYHKITYYVLITRYRGKLNLRKTKRMCKVCYDLCRTQTTEETELWENVRK